MADNLINKPDNTELLRMTAQLVAAYMQKNPVASDQIPDLIGAVYDSLRTLETGAAPSAAPSPDPAVPIRKSISPEYLICLEDGRRLKMLKRHLRTTYGLTPEAYRRKWGLPPDYPMVAPNYAQARSAFAKRIGLGRGGRPRARRGARKKAE